MPNQTRASVFPTERVHQLSIVQRACTVRQGVTASGGQSSPRVSGFDSSQASTSKSLKPAVNESSKKSGASASSAESNTPSAQLSQARSEMIALSTSLSLRSTPSNVLASILEGLIAGLHAETRWCGSDNSILPEYLTPELFPLSCKVHDMCYSGSDSTKSECDRQFLSDMLTEKPGKLREALGYFAAVSLGGTSSFNRAREAASSTRATHQFMDCVHDAPCP